MLIVDSSGLPKQGKFSVDVARQYCGNLGKIANCQQGIFCAYRSHKGAAFVDCRLYMPQRWFDDEYAEKGQRCGAPEDLQFTTDPQLALGMVRTLCKRKKLPFTWVLGDETYGADPKFLDGVEALGKHYPVEVPKSTQVYLGLVHIRPAQQGRGRRRTYPRVMPGTAEPVEVQHVPSRLLAKAWTVQSLKEGIKGPILEGIACIQVTHCRCKGRKQPGAPAWLVLRQGIEPGAKLKMFLSNAPDGTSADKLGQLSAMRWPIETIPEEAKGELGMDHYEVRSWHGWHHQMTLTFLAHH